MPQEPQAGSKHLSYRIVGVDSEELQDFQVPTFVNSTGVWHFGENVYLDMALLSVEQMNALPTLKEEGELTVAVYDRFVMSPSVFSDFAKKVNKVRERLKAEGLVRDETTQKAEE